MRRLLVALLVAYPLSVSAQTTETIFLKCTVSGWRTSYKWDHGEYVSGPRDNVSQADVFKINPQERLIDQYFEHDKQFFGKSLCDVAIPDRVTRCVFNDRIFSWERIGGFGEGSKKFEHLSIHIDRKTGEIKVFGRSGRTHIDQDENSYSGTCETTTDPTIDNRPNKF